MADKTKRAEGLPVINRFAAGIDVGSRFHVVAVAADLDPEPVQTFSAFTTDLNRLADWLIRCGITTVAMESTGVYWIALYEILESRGLTVLLANAREVRAVPGRKTDIKDAQWLQKLHACGLLRASFRPGRDICALRAYLRQRERLLDYTASHIQHLQKALTHMNLQLHHIVSDVTGVTGLRIVRAIIEGERDAEVLSEMRDVRCKATAEEIRGSLHGNYQPEHLFALRQALDLHDYYQLKVAECDAEIERVMAIFRSKSSTPSAPIPAARHRTRAANALAFDVRTSLYEWIGTDLTQIHGLGPNLALRLVGECGTDLSRWPTSKHFASWLTLCPGSKISGGKVLSSRSRKSANRVVAHLRLAAVTVGKTQTALGAFYRRLSARIGKAKAVTATARKIAVLFYNAMRYGMEYRDPGANAYEEKYRERLVKGLGRRAAELGFSLQPIATQASVS